MRKYVPYFIVIGIAAILLAIPFFWNDWPPDFSHQIKNEKVADYFTSLGAIITGVTLIMLIRQIDLTRRQKQPNLVIDQTKIVITPYEDMEGKIQLSMEERDGEHKFATFIIQNYGEGVATDIKIDWYLISKGKKDIFGKASHNKEAVRGNNYLKFPLQGLLIKHIEKMYFAKTGVEAIELVDSKIFVHITYEDSDQVKHEKIYQGSVLIEKPNGMADSGLSIITYSRMRENYYKVGKKKIKLPPKPPKF